ncbi:polysaccharide deacetylase family protein [candidate division GN15 bacterium]|nr:polysaccharide deacetylase family protein [candidate division GN15 bacterium]
MAGLSSMIERVGHGLGLWRVGYAIEGLRHGDSPMLVVFTYHRVVDHDRGKIGFLGYDWGLDYRLFNAHLDAIARYFDVLDLQTYTDVVTGKRTISRRSCLITFDDADSEFIDYALPSLRQHGLPSVIFVPTDYIDTNRRFWHLLITNAVSKLDQSTLEALQEAPGDVPDDVAVLLKQGSLATYESRRFLGRELCRLLDNRPQEVIDRAVAAIEDHTGPSYDLGIGCMSWDDLRMVAGKGVELQSHTVNHRKLALLSADEVRDELVRSREKLERELGNEVTAICYPAGSFNRETLEVAQSCGYVTGFTTQVGAPQYPLDGIDRFAIPRLTINGETIAEIEAYVGKLPLKRLLRGSVA